MSELIKLEDAVSIVLDNVSTMSVETVPVLDAVGRVAARDLCSDIDVSSFAHAAMDGFALRASQLANASQSNPVHLSVAAEVPAGTVYEGPIADDECVRIMTGAPTPAHADAVVKYEDVVVVEGDGRLGSLVSFAAPVPQGKNIREAGEEAKAGECVISAGEVVGVAGVGVLASCGMVEVPTYRRPRVAIIATGSELVDPTEVPPAGKIRNSNALAMAACVKSAGGIPDIFPIVPDTFEGLEQAIVQAVSDHDVVLSTGGAANGDFDFIKPVAEKLGQVFFTGVNMRPGKAQTFALVRTDGVHQGDGGCSTRNVPVFGLPGNPGAAYCGFQLIIRPALRQMQGYEPAAYPSVQARLTADIKKKDPRRIYMRAVLSADKEGYVVDPAKNQSSGLFGVIQRTNCLAILPEGLEGKKAGDTVECITIHAF